MATRPLMGYTDLFPYASNKRPNHGHLSVFSFLEPIKPNFPIFDVLVFEPLWQRFGFIHQPMPIIGLWAAFLCKYPGSFQFTYLPQKAHVWRSSHDSSVSSSKCSFNAKSSRLITSESEYPKANDSM